MCGNMQLENTFRVLDLIWICKCGSTLIVYLINGVFLIAVLVQEKAEVECAFNVRVGCKVEWNFNGITFPVMVLNESVRQRLSLSKRIQYFVFFHHKRFLLFPIHYLSSDLSRFNFSLSGPLFTELVVSLFVCIRSLFSATRDYW